MSDVQCFDCGEVFSDNEECCPICSCQDVQEIVELQENANVIYSDVHVKLSGKDGNAYAIMGNVSGALRRHGVPKAKIDEYIKESTSGDYSHLLETAMRWVDVS